MTNEVKLSDKEIETFVKKRDGVVAASITDGPDKKVRNFLVIGCGDGGCNIASLIKTQIPMTKVIAYNTSERAMNNLTTDINIIPLKTDEEAGKDEKTEDGSGKDRGLSQSIFKRGSYRQVANKAIEYINADNTIEYILITTTTGGGTGGGISPMLAKFMADNLPIPVIVLGVYPSLSEDATAMYNAMAWQSEVEKYNIPYIILDNNKSDSNPVTIHRIVNELAADTIKLLSGVLYGNTNITAVDNQDMYTLLTMPGRISAIGSADKLPVGKSLDDYLIEHFTQSQMVAPVNLKGVALFVKGPEDLISRVDTSLTKFSAQYGVPAIQYVHLEESKDTYIAVVCSGCGEASDRLAMCKQRYDEVMDGVAETQSSVDTLLQDMSSPIGGSNRAGKKPRISLNTELDLSALDL